MVCSGRYCEASMFFGIFRGDESEVWITRADLLRSSCVVVSWWRLRNSFVRSLHLVVCFRWIGSV
jgi:hypothetical protein